MAQWIVAETEDGFSVVRGLEHYHVGAKRSMARWTAQQLNAAEQAGRPLGDVQVVARAAREMFGSKRRQGR